MVHFLSTLINNGRFSKIVHLPEPGHRFLPCDLVFSVQVEKRKPKKEVLYFGEWYSLVENCGKKFTVR